MRANQLLSEEAFQDALAHLYDTFGSYSPRPDAFVWNGPSEERRKRLYEKPLRELPDEALGAYYGIMPVDPNLVEDFKHFLPRILERIALGALGRDYDHPIWMERLNIAEWNDWPEREKKAILRFFRSWWSYVLADASIKQFYVPDPHLLPDAHEVLSGFLQLDVDVMPLLDEWEGTASVSAGIHLAQFIDREARQIAKKGRIWHFPAPSDRDVAEWLASQETGSKLERAFFELADTEWDEMLSGAMEEWRYLHHAWKRNKNEEAA
jgi:hypothetical protein